MLWISEIVNAYAKGQWDFDIAKTLKTIKHSLKYETTLNVTSEGQSCGELDANGKTLQGEIQLYLSEDNRYVQEGYLNRNKLKLSFPKKCYKQRNLSTKNVSVFSELPTNSTNQMHK